MNWDLEKLKGEYFIFKDNVTFRVKENIYLGLIEEFKCKFYSIR